jgi:hypothetical protein
MPPIALTDDQLTVITNAAHPLPPQDRAAFLERVAEMLRGVEIGDGAVSRAARTAQAEFLRPPQINGATVPRWSR